MAEIDRFPNSYGDTVEIRARLESIRALALKELKDKEAECGVDPTANMSIPDKRAAYKKQYKQIRGKCPDVTCVCGKTINMHYAYRCLYCGIYFCETCAKAHFGQEKD